MIIPPRRRPRVRPGTEDSAGMGEPENEVGWRQAVGGALLYGSPPLAIALAWGLTLATGEHFVLLFPVFGFVAVLGSGAGAGLRAGGSLERRQVAGLIPGFLGGVVYLVLGLLTFFADSVVTLLNAAR